MVLYNAEKPKPERGILVIDTGTIFFLLPKLEHELLIGDGIKKVSLLDSLFLLAENGYQVVIPEMVAIEAGMLLHDGRKVNPPPNHKYNGKILVRKLSEDFLADVINSPANIYIEPPSVFDNSKPADFVRAISEIHTPQNSSFVKIQKIKILLSQHDTHDYGDIAALKLIKSMRKHNAPIFFISDDRTAISYIDRITGGNIQSISGGELIVCLANEKLLQHVGIKDPEDPRQFFVDWKDRLDDLGLTFRQDCLDAKLALFEMGGSEAANAFSENLSGVKDNMLAKELQTGEELEVSQVSKIAQFRQKYPGVKNAQDRS